MSQFFLLLPLVISGILHMVVVKRHVFPGLAVPIAQPIFGANKTWRGVVLMPLFGSCGLTLSVWTQDTWVFGRGPLPVHLGEWSSIVALGGCLGLGYVLFELPNSFLKRRLGIAPGEAAESWRILFFLLDRLDSATGCALVYLIFGVAPFSVIMMIPTGMAIHITVTFLLKSVGLKERM